jgi:hypothetical protein
VTPKRCFQAIFVVGRNSGTKPLDAIAIEIEADDVEAELRQRYRARGTDVTGPDDADDITMHGQTLIGDSPWIKRYHPRQSPEPTLILTAH